MKDIPTHEQIHQAFKCFCKTREACEDCPIGDVRDDGNFDREVCRSNFMYLVLAGKRDLEGNPLASPVTPTSTIAQAYNGTKSYSQQEKEWFLAYATEKFMTPKPKLPKWCKVGQWVRYDDDIEHRLGKITHVQDDGYILIDAPCADGGLKMALTYYATAYPVRFRPYTDEEAKALVRKVIEFDNTGHALLLTAYKSNRTAPYVLDGTCFTYNELKSYNATIDGVPIGVPEIDEDAMKEEEQ